MFKRGGGGGAGGGGGGGNRGRRHWDEHDNRDRRRVSFKNNLGKEKNVDRQRILFRAFMKKTQDEDVDMNNQNGIVSMRGGNKGNFRGNKRRDGRLNSPAPKSNFARKLMQGTSPWYQVTIPYGKQYDKPFLLSTLQSAMTPDVYVPFFFNYSGNAAIFYVDDFAMAEKLNDLDRQIGMPNGFKLAVRVRSGTPNVALHDEVLDKMKVAMAGRYNPNTKALDLTKFHADPALEEVFCALFRPTIMLAAINIMSENIPDLQALNLDNNKLHVLDHFKNLLKKLPNLKILYLGHNRITHVNSLEPLKGLPLVELFLEGNPLADRFKEKDAYVREVRKRFPKILRLDGKDLPPVIGFDVSDEVNLPLRKASYLCNTEGSVVVKQFLEQYFAIYDSESRQPLLDAYHENAVFSLSAWYGPGSGHNSSSRLHSYFSNGRNLLKLPDSEARRKHLKTGKLQVVSLLNDLPKSQHDPLSFCVDMTVCTPNLIMLTISGVFKETSWDSSYGKPNAPPLRGFHRTMIIVPQGAGFCIRNDMMHVTTPTVEQEENSFKPPAIVNEPQPPVYGSPVVPQPIAPTSVQVVSPTSTDTQHQMVQALSIQTNMNLEWSRICLEQTNWDYQRSVVVFNNLNAAGKIPPEAFVK